MTLDCKANVNTLNVPICTEINFTSDSAHTHLGCIMSHIDVLKLNKWGYNLQAGIPGKTCWHSNLIRQKQTWLSKYVSETISNCHLHHVTGFSGVGNAFHRGSWSGLSSCLSLVPFSDDSISRALWYESLRNNRVRVSFTSIWMEGRWFSAKTHRWAGKGWRLIVQGRPQAEPTFAEKNIDLLFRLHNQCFLKLMR